VYHIAALTVAAIISFMQNCQFCIELIIAATDGSEDRFCSGSVKIRSTRIGSDSVPEYESVCSLKIGLISAA